MVLLSLSGRYTVRLASRYGSEGTNSTPNCLGIITTAIRFGEINKSSASLGLDDNLQNYLLEVSLHEPEACRQLREQTQALPDANTWLHAQAPGRFDLSLVPIGDGLSLLRKL